jgi:glucose-1-phosphate cytidylyltransferase
VTANGKNAPGIDVVLLCGGRGTRLAPDTDLIPKPLVRVAGRPILWHIMRHFAGSGFKRFVLCLGYKGELIRDYFLDYELHSNDFTITLGSGPPRVVTHRRDYLDWEVTCADTGLEAQTGARIARIDQYLRSPSFFCTYGDGVSDVDLQALLAFHEAHGRLATVTGVHPQARFGELVVDGDSRVRQFREKPRQSSAGGYINGGFFVFRREVLDYLSTDEGCVLEREPLERIAAAGELRVFKHDGFWQCMDTPKDRDLLDKVLRAAPVGPVAPQPVEALFGGS